MNDSDWALVFQAAVMFSMFGLGWMSAKADVKRKRKEATAERKRS